MISIHALRVEGAVYPPYPMQKAGHFYPRPPGGGRRKRLPAFYRFHKISIHALRVEGDFNDYQIQIGVVISIHALRVEGDEGVYRERL